MKNQLRVDQILFFSPIVIAIVIAGLSSSGSSMSNFFNQVIVIISSPFGMLYLTVFFASLVSLYGTRQRQSYGAYLIAVLVWQLLPWLVNAREVLATTTLESLLAMTVTMGIYLLAGSLVYGIITATFQLLIIPEIQRYGFTTIAKREALLFGLLFIFGIIQFILMLTVGFSATTLTITGVVVVILGMLSGVFGKLPLSVSLVGGVCICHIPLFVQFLSTGVTPVVHPYTFLSSVLCFFIPFIGCQIAKSYYNRTHSAQTLIK